MGRRLRRRWGLIAFIAIAMVAAGAVFMMNRADSEPEAVTYETEAVESGTISVTVSGSGYVELAGRTEVWPEGAAVVESLEVSEGSLVETDQVLLTLDDAAWGVDDEVVAPESGLVWSLSVEEGDEVGEPLATSQAGDAQDAPVVIVPAEPLAVRVDVNEVDAPELATDLKATIIFDAIPDLSVTGRVSEIDREGTVTQGVVTFGVLIELDVQEAALKPGMSAVATIVTAVAQDSLLAPNAAVKTDDDGAEYVEVLDAGSDTPRGVGVTTGLRNATHTVIESGLAAGDEVVVKTTTPSDDTDEDSGGFGFPGMGRPH